MLIKLKHVCKKLNLFIRFQVYFIYIFNLVNYFNYTYPLTVLSLIDFAWVFPVICTKFTVTAYQQSSEESQSGKRWVLIR